MARCVVLFFLAGLRCALAGAAADLALQVQQISLDTDACYRVTELNFSKEDLKVYFASGYLIFTKPIAGFRQGAVFIASADAGDAEVLLIPPSRSERLSLATFTESPNLDEHFEAAAFIFTDNTAEDLIELIQGASAPKNPELGHVIADKWNSVLRNLSSSFETGVVHDLLSKQRKTGFFYMAVSGKQLNNFDVLYDPNSPDQISAGKIVYRDNRTFFDTWTSFPSRSVRKGAAPPEPTVVLDNFRIDATIDDALYLKAVTRATMTAKESEGAIRVGISPEMRVTEALIDGQPVEVFDRDSMRSTLIEGRDNRDILLVPQSPLDASKPHELEVHHEGTVIAKAGPGVYHVVSRGNWYPRVGLEFALYDLTFRYPKDLTLVATGSPVEERTEDASRVARWKTDSPIRFAGFNLGDFQLASISHNGYKIDVYANRHVENALQPKAPLPLPQVVTPLRRRIPDPTAGLAPLPPDPAARMGLLEKDVLDALDFMTAEFGPPPFHNLAVTPIPAGFGQGFPSLIYLSTLAYMNPEQRPEALHQHFEQTFYSELLVTHEVAHQWWGNIVIPAGYADEWLIESLANYSALLALERKNGEKARDAVLDAYRHHLLQKTESGRTLESIGPIIWGRRLESSLAPSAWNVVAYEKGTWIIHMLRRQLGDAKFFALLREVATRYRFKPISVQQFHDLARQFTSPKSPDRTLTSFFETWVEGTGIPAVKLSYAWRGAKLSGTVSEANVSSDFATFVPVEVQTSNQKTVYWLPTGSDPIPFSIPLKRAPTKVALLSSDCLMTISK